MTCSLLVGSLPGAPPEVRLTFWEMVLLGDDECTRIVPQRLAPESCGAQGNLSMKKEDEAEEQQVPSLVKLVERLHTS